MAPQFVFIIHWQAAMIKSICQANHARAGKTKEEQVQWISESENMFTTYFWGLSLISLHEAISLSLSLSLSVCMRGFVCIPPRRVNEKLPLLIEYTKQMAGRTPIQCNAIKRTQGLEPLQPFLWDPMAPFKTFRMWNRKYNSTVITKLMRADAEYLNDLYCSIIKLLKAFRFLPSQEKVSGSLKWSLQTVTFMLTPRPCCSSSCATHGLQTKPAFFE